jgi:prepilin peptidase CpaA
MAAPIFAPILAGMGDAMPEPPASLLLMLTTLLGLALLALAALHDVAARTIPNWIPATLAIGAIAPLLLSPSAGARLAAALLLFGGAVVLWRCGWMGGGDAKLLGAVGLLVPPDRVGLMVVAIGLAGALLALPYIACRHRIARPQLDRPAGLVVRAWRAERFRLRRGGPLPYGVAIAAGATFALLGGAS